MRGVNGQIVSCDWQGSVALFDRQAFEIVENNGGVSRCNTTAK